MNKHPPDTHGPLALEPDEYREDLAEFGWSEAEENAFLETLWRICATFVDIGFGLDPVQMVRHLQNLDAVEKTTVNADSGFPESGPVLNKNHPEDFNHVARGNPNKEEDDD